MKMAVSPLNLNRHSVCNPKGSQQSMLQDGDDLAVQGLESRSIGFNTWLFARKHEITKCRTVSLPNGKKNPLPALTCRTGIIQGA